MAKTPKLKSGASPAQGPVVKAKGKKIIIFSDGTGNSAAAIFKTNVRRLYEALDLSWDDQIAVYDDGVGSSGFRPWAALSGALGIGLARNVKSLYSFLCRHYMPESATHEADKIYIFGFSRGAFTARVLVGLIKRQGIIPQHRFKQDENKLTRLVNSAFRNYRREAYKLNWSLVPVARFIRDRWLQSVWRQPDAEARGLAKGNYMEGNGPDLPPARIAFLGLWDTVEAYGLPIDELTVGWSKWIWPLSTNEQLVWAGVDKVAHALALDDERNSFHPRLIDETEEISVLPKQPGTRGPPANIKDERISQVWFTGMHADVGGGYPNDGLSFVTLDWMVKQLTATGVSPVLRSSAVDEIEKRADALGYLNDSRKGFASYYRYQPRKLPLLAKTQDVTIKLYKIHESVFERLKTSAGRYAPIVVPGDYAIVTRNGDLLPPEASTKSVETSAEAGVRMTTRERTWDWVWARRVTYFLTLFATIYLALMPWIGLSPFGNVLDGLTSFNDEAKCVSSPFCFLSGIPKLLGSFLPGFASPWIESFSTNPAIYATHLAIIAGLMWLSAWLSRRIHGSMAATWFNKPTEAEAPLSWLHNIRTAPWYTALIFDFFKGWMLPNFFGLSMFVVLFLVLPAVGLMRVQFAYRDATGAYCTQVVPTITPPTNGQKIRLANFDGQNVCADTGFNAEDGAIYEITISPMNEWSDGSYSADPEGLKEVFPWYIRIPAFLLKRDIGEDYMVPTARIIPVKKTLFGGVGQDEYVLKPLIPRAENERGKQGPPFVARFTAASTGRLFLYVNDALVFWPKRWESYANNKVKAEIWIRRVTE